MFLLLPLLITAAISNCTLALSTSYQYVKFLKKSDPFPQTHSHVQTKSTNIHSGINSHPTGSRKQRSFYYPYPLLSIVDNLDEFLPDTVFLPPQTSYLHHLYQPEINLHSDLTNSNTIGDYDPYFVPASRAKSIASHWYRKGLFFNDISHAEGLLKLQERRLENGLPENRLGSLNYLSPFSRVGQHEPVF